MARTVEGASVPNTPTHDVITIVTGIVLVPISLAGFAQAGFAPPAIALQTALLVGGHLISGLLFSPDLDLQSEIDDRWGPLFWIWRPYMWLIPHRHFWSHGLVLPPILRLLYVYLIMLSGVTAGVWLLNALGITVTGSARQVNAAMIDFVRANQRETLVFIAGFITGGAAHSIADWLVTGGKYILLGLGIRVTRDYRNHDRWVPRRRSRRIWG
jgi:uncharacterized metal-binding protein